MAISENGLPVLPEGSPLLYRWAIRTKAGMVYMTFRNGSVGLIMAYVVMLWSDLIEAVPGKILDDWGYAYRPIRGQLTGYSNHASGSAADTNALKHPLGKAGTVVKYLLWRTILRTRLGGKVRWGGDYHARLDQMHNEIAPGVGIAGCEVLAAKILGRKRGMQLIKDNPTQLKVITS